MTLGTSGKDADEPLVNIYLGGGTIPIVVDNGSEGLVLNQADLTTAQLDALGNPTATGVPITFGTTTGVAGDTYYAHVNFGNGIRTGYENIDVLTAVNGNSSLAQFPDVLGIGVNAPGGVVQLSGHAMSVTAFLPGALKTGELINLPSGQLEFGPNPLPPLPRLPETQRRTTWGSNRSAAHVPRACRYP